MLLNLLFVAIGVGLVSYGASYLVEGASSFAKKLGITDMVIGLTVVAFGTSTPELVVSLISSIKGNGDVAIGNVIGSNIFNILLILGISALIYPISIQRNTVWKEIPLSLLAAIIALVMANDIFLDGNSINSIARIDGIILLAFFVIYIYYTFGIAKVEGGQEEPGSGSKNYSIPVALLFILGGIAALTFGGRLIVNNAVDLAKVMGVSDSIIGLTLVAAGTSIPELATSIAAAIKKNSDIAIGNVVGSNIFNIFFILGISSTVTPLRSTGITNIDYLVCIAASVVLFITCFLFKPKTLFRVEGAILILGYVLYTGYLISRAT